MFTRIHYKAIASILADIPNLDDREIALTPQEVKIAQDVKTIIAKDLAEYFIKDNDKFSKDKFFQACKVSIRGI